MDLFISGSREGNLFFIAVGMQRMPSELASLLSKKKKRIQKVKFLGAILGAIMQSLCQKEITIDKTLFSIK